MKSQDNFNKILVAGDNGAFILQVDSIIRIEAYDGNCLIFLDDGTQYLLTKTLKYCESILPPEKFVRVHKSHIVNFYKVFFLGKKSLQLKGGIEVPVSKTFKNRILIRFGNK